ncbi:potassium channel family protein [Cyanobium sp. CH-040]|uniref:potassium channel family protein n=1 Tax=Cyanobium sp. CH-040 TaxID=2823708 RepID=UPI0020CFDD52|nr:potassium channel family protein [Cyanobium sp. CH-040]
MASATRQHHYRLLLVACMAMLAIFTFPDPWNRLASPGYLALGVVMLRALGGGGERSRRGTLHRRLYRGTGIATLAVGGLWLLTPLELRDTGVPVVVLWVLFSLWSAQRLIHQLGKERSVDEAVLSGALAGYLMLGLSGGILSAAVETVAPGSFTGVDLTPHGPDGLDPVWRLDFVKLNYFAFVSLTTTGYGDILPITPAAQMLSIALAVAGNSYLAIVLGVLIGRFSMRGSDDRNSHDRDGLDDSRD